MKVVVTDFTFTSLAEEQRICDKLGYQLVPLQCKTADDVIAHAADADALLVQYAPITESVLERLQQCKVIVRYGIGVDTIDLNAAEKHAVPICNVPDYGIEDVADHTAALVLTSARQIPFFDASIRQGHWPSTPRTPLLSFSDMCFAVIGAGRIGRSVLERMQAFGFQCVAYDPFVSAEELREVNVQKFTLDEVFTKADVISLHLPLNEETNHLVDRKRLQSMKKTAILVNTSRGGLIDTQALAHALNANEIAFAGLDVFKNEPLEEEHPLRNCKNAVLTPHIAYYSDASISRLQRFAAEEVERALSHEPLRCRVV